MEQIIGISSQLARLSQVAASQLFPIDHGLVLVLTIWPHFFFILLLLFYITAVSRTVSDKVVSS